VNQLPLIAVCSAFAVSLLPIFIAAPVLLYIVVRGIIYVKKVVKLKSGIREAAGKLKENGAG